MATKYSTARELRALERESEKMRALKSDPYTFGSIQDKREFYKREKQVNDQLQAASPPPVKDAADGAMLNVRLSKLKEFIVEEDKERRLAGMPSHYDTWQMRAGVTGQVRRWNDKINNWNIDAEGKPVRSKYGAAHEYKDILTRTTPREEQEVDPDFRSLEKLRPEKREGTAADYSRSSFAPGRGVSDEKWEEAVGPKEPPKPPKERKERKRRERAPVPLELQCKQLKKDGSACVGRALIGHDYCMAHKPKE